MAHNKQGWKDALQTIKSERSRQDNRDNQRAKKKVAELHYKRRKLDKDVKRYIKHDPIHGSEIERIGRKHGFYIESAPFGEDQLPHKNA